MLQNRHSVELGICWSKLLEPIPARIEGLSLALASNTLLVPSRLAFLQRSASGTGCATRFATAFAVVHVAA